MKLPLSLIKSFIHLDLQPSRIAETLTLLGLEVDRIENEHPPFSGVVVGEIVSCTPHPNAQKLQIAKVNDGEQLLSVVCRAPNCRPGLKTAFATPGALLPGSERKIEKCSLKGVESNGMLCSERELGISQRDEGIIELPEQMRAGQDLSPILWDPVFELSLTPNLGHCMSALGVARELSAALQIPIHKPAFSLQENPNSELNKKVEIAISDPQLTPSYFCRLIEGVQIGPSPFWLQQQLLACGMTPICNAVDIANYVMLKMGQPLHVFDYDKLEGHYLQISLSTAQHTFLGLDGIERDIPAGTLLTFDRKKPVAIAGILGGANSAVTEQSKNLLIEAKMVDPSLIRKGTKSLDLRTDSSQRFERGIDPNGMEAAIAEACALIMELCGGHLAKGTIEIKKHSFAPKTIQCRSDRVNQLLGTRLSLTEIEEIFRRLGFSTQELTTKGILLVAIPLFRSDISEEIDLIEEVARIYGYNHIEKRAVRFATSQIPHDPAYLFENEVRKRMIAFGLQEFLTPDLISPKLSRIAKEWIHSDVRLLTALCPKTEEYSILRPSLLPGLMQAAAGNFSYRNQIFSAFEIGRIHFLQKNGLVEQPIAAIMLTGKIAPAHWSCKPADVDFFDLKGLLENLFEGLRIPLTFQISEHLSFHPGRQSNLYCNEMLVGSFGEVHPALCALLDIKQRLLYAELNLHHLLEMQQRQVHMHPTPKFPSSDRDWTIPLDASLPIQRVFDAIQLARSLLLEKVELIDLYIPETDDQKNASFRFTYRDPLKTISFEEVDAHHNELVEKVRNSLAN